MQIIYKDENVELLHGDSSQWYGECDLVITNPYAVLPNCLKGKPMFICDFTHRKALAERRCHTSLELVSLWYNGRNSIWYGNMGAYIPQANLMDLVPFPEGWFPDELVERLLVATEHPITIWDGFCGRGTVGKVAREHGHKFIGIDRDRTRVDLAVEYINGSNKG